MTNGMVYWVLVWAVMASAFSLAWLFIVKGCERLDAAHPDANDPNSGTMNAAVPSSSQSTDLASSSPEGPKA